MEVTIRQIGDVSVVKVFGKIIMGTQGTTLREKVSELFQNGQQHILLNLEEVSYLDAHGIGELVFCRRLASKRNGTVKLLKPSSRICDLLHLAKMEDLFELFFDEEEALESFPSCLAPESSSTPDPTDSA